MRKILTFLSILSDHKTWNFPFSIHSVFIYLLSNQNKQLLKSLKILVSLPCIYLLVRKWSKDFYCLLFSTYFY